MSNPLTQVATRSAHTKYNQSGQNGVDLLDIAVQFRGETKINTDYKDKNGKKHAKKQKKNILDDKIRLKYACCINKCYFFQFFVPSRNNGQILPP